MVGPTLILRMLSTRKRLVPEQELELLISILTIRFSFIGAWRSDLRHAFFVAHKIIYMEVSPKGYYNNISVIYKVNTNK